MKSSFGELYKTGQSLSLLGFGGEVVTRAIVLNYDPSKDNWRPSGLSKSGSDRPSPNHWHVAVKSPTSEEWLPAAIWNDNEEGRFGAHYTREQRRIEARGIPLAYTAQELGQKICDVASHVTKIVPFELSLE